MTAAVVYRCMLGLRFYECRSCATIYAVPDVPPSCSKCEGSEFVDLTDQLQDDTYFSPSQDTRTR
jgi:formate dehydrogenase maturation protein FdhE